MQPRGYMESLLELGRKGHQSRSVPCMQTTQCPKGSFSTSGHDNPTVGFLCTHLGLDGADQWLAGTAGLAHLVSFAAWHKWPTQTEGSKLLPMRPATMPQARKRS
jgi:hypothetical protein